MAKRKGDQRPRENEATLTWRPAHDEPLRWLPRHGEPLCVMEWFSQHVIRAIAFLPVYTAIVATLSLIVLWWTR